MRTTIDPNLLHDGEGGRMLAGAPWQRLAVIGDSIVEARQYDPDAPDAMPWPDRLARELAPAEYLNLGRGGAFAAEVLAEQLPCALAFAPDLAVVACGGNDALHASFDADAVGETITEIVAALRDAGALVMVCGLFDIAATDLLDADVRERAGRRLHRLDDVTRAVTQREGALFIDVHRHPASRDPRIYSSDRVHASARGQAVFTAVAVRTLGAHLLGTRRADEDNAIGHKKGPA